MHLPFVMMHVLLACVQHVFIHIFVVLNHFFFLLTGTHELWSAQDRCV